MVKLAQSMAEVSVVKALSRPCHIGAKYSNQPSTVRALIRANLCLSPLRDRSWIPFREESYGSFSNFLFKFICNDSLNSTHSQGKSFWLPFPRILTPCQHFALPQKRGIRKFYTVEVIIYPRGREMLSWGRVLPLSLQGKETLPWEEILLSAFGRILTQGRFCFQLR